MAHLLLIDDDPALIPEQVRQAFPSPAHTVAVACTGAAGLEHVRTRLPDVILLDLRLPDQSGLEVYQRIHQLDARIPVIFITLAKAADAAIEAMKQGAYDYLFKPLNLHQLRRVAGEALDVAQRMRAPAVAAEAAPDPDVEGAIVGACLAMSGLLRRGVQAVVRRGKEATKGPAGNKGPGGLRVRAPGRRPPTVDM